MPLHLALRVVVNRLGAVNNGHCRPSAAMNMHATVLIDSVLSSAFGSVLAGKCGTKNPRDKRLGNGVCDDDLNTGEQLKTRSLL